MPSGTNNYVKPYNISATSLLVLHLSTSNFEDQTQQREVPKWVDGLGLNVSKIKQIRIFLFLILFIYMAPLGSYPVDFVPLIDI
jgi:hypothetical protein